MSPKEFVPLDDDLIVFYTPFHKNLILIYSRARKRVVLELIPNSNLANKTDFLAVDVLKKVDNGVSFLNAFESKCHLISGQSQLVTNEFDFGEYTFNLKTSDEQVKAANDTLSALVLRYNPGKKDLYVLFRGIGMIFGLDESGAVSSAFDFPFTYNFFPYLYGNVDRSVGCIYNLSDIGESFWTDTFGEDVEFPKFDQASNPILVSYKLDAD